MRRTVFTAIGKSDPFAKWTPAPNSLSGMIGLARKESLNDALLGKRLKFVADRKLRMSIREDDFHPTEQWSMMRLEVDLSDEYFIEWKLNFEGLR